MKIGWDDVPETGVSSCFGGAVLLGGGEHVGHRPAWHPSDGDRGVNGALRPGG
jgi:hypothetical protein